MSLAPIIKQLVINGLLTQSAARGVKRGSAWVGFGVLAGGIGFVALTWFSIAAYGYLSTQYAGPVAASIVGGVLTVLSAFVMLMGYLTINRKFEKMAAKAKRDEGMLGSLESMLQSALGGFEEPIRDNPKMAMLAAILAGFAAGDKFGDKTN